MLGPPMRLAASGAALVLLLVGCGGGTAPVEAAAEEGGKLALTLPSQILGLKVTLEQPSKGLKDIERPYFDALALLSLRENDLLRASLEIGRFNSLARPGNAGFRNQILNKIGSKPPEPITVGRDTVYFTSGNRQSIFVWFEGRGLFVLIAHQDFLFPRTLLRRLIELEELKF